MQPTEEGFNTIEEYLSRLPESTKTINLSKKRLTVLPDLSRFTELQKLYIAKNNLDELPPLPQSLTHLFCSQNHLTRLPPLPPGLEELHCPENELETLPKLPDTLKSLTCDHNNLTKIPLPTPKLEYLYCDNNNFSEEYASKVLGNTFIYQNRNDINQLRQRNGLPQRDENGEAIYDDIDSKDGMEYKDNTQENSMNENNENQNNDDDDEIADQIKQIDLEQKKETEEELKKEEQAIQNKDYLEALNDYFRDKTAYESGIRKMKSDIFQRERNNKKKAKRLMENIKPKCIYCQRPVGSIFSHKDERYKIKCGDFQSPCNLNVELYCGSADTIDTQYKLFRETILEYKQKIILHKMDTLFNYISDKQSVAMYKPLMNDYNETVKLLAEIESAYNHLYNNVQVREQIIEKNEFIFRLIEKSKSYLEEYKRTQEREQLVLAVETIQNELLPEAEKVRYLKHEVMEVNNISLNPQKHPEFALFTFPVQLSKLNYFIGEPPRIIKYIR